MKSARARNLQELLGPQGSALREPWPGTVWSYVERITSGFERPTDQEWASLLHSSPPADVAWMQELVVRQRRPRSRARGL